MSNSDIKFCGLCQISEGGDQLTEGGDQPAEGGDHLAKYQDHAVSSISRSTTWRLTHPVPSSPDLIFTLVTDHPGVVPLVLTLGKKGWFQQRIGVFVEPLITPVPKSQLWTLQDVVRTERVPMLLTARIQSAQYTHLSACEGIVGVALPRLYLKVGAGPKPLLEGRKWTFDYFAEEE